MTTCCVKVSLFYSNKDPILLKVSTMTSSETCQVTTADNRTEVADYLEMMLGPVQMDDHLTLVIITLFYTTVLVTGILGNISVCLVIFRSSHLHTAMNYYLVSLAFADLMIIILGENLHLAESERNTTPKVTSLFTQSTKNALNPFSNTPIETLGVAFVFSLNHLGQI